MKRTFLILFTLLFSVIATARDFQPIIWSPAQIPAVKKAIEDGDPAYKGSYTRLLKDADIALGKPEPSVVDKAMTPPSGDKRDYVSIGRYWWPNPDTADGLPYIRKDGHSNPELKEYDRERLAIMATSVINLSLASHLSGKSDYARKAVDILDKWFISSKTRMNPHMNYGQMIPGHNNGMGRGEGVLDTYSFVWMIDAVNLLWADGYMNKKIMDGMKSWFADYVVWMTTHPIGIEEMEAKNNHGVAYDVQLAIYASFAGKDALAKQTVNEFAAKRIFPQIEPDGKQPLELLRTTAFGYSTFNIVHMLDMCDVARNMGVDLFNVASEDGRSISRAIDYIAQFIGKESEFPYKQIQDWQKVQYDFADQLYRASKYAPKGAAYRKLYMDSRSQTPNVMHRLLHYSK